MEATPVPSQSLRIKPTQAKRALSAPVPGRRSGYEKEVQPSMAMDEESNPEIYGYVAISWPTPF